jgi:colanic acid biosynthesis glycosyl transferase WcaI
MKIVLSSLNFSPELTGIGKYSGEMADGLVDRGHEVVVVCAPPYYPHWRVGAGYGGLRYTVERPRPGLTVIRCPLWVPGNPTAVKRVLHLLSFMLSSMPVMLALAAWRPALVFAVAPAFFCAPTAWLTARLAGAKAWLHIQDFELDAAFDLGLLHGGWTRRLCASAERFLLRRFDQVSTISRRMLRKLAYKGVPLDRGQLLPNWVDLHAIHPVSAGVGSPALRRSLGLSDDQVVFLFSGSMNRKQGLPVLFEAMDLLGDRADMVLVLCGDGELREQVGIVASSRVQVRVLDLQPMDRFNELLNMADVHLLPQLANAADLVMPSKLSGMLASGRPVVAAALPGTEIARVVQGRGLLVAPECAVDFARAMLALADDASERHRLGANAREYAESALGFGRLLAHVEACLMDTVLQPTATAGQSGVASPAAIQGLSG